MGVFEQHTKQLNEIAGSATGPRAYLFAGADDYLISRFCRETVDALKKAKPGAELEQIESDKDPISDILFSDGLFASEKIVWIRNGEDFFGKGAKELAPVLESFLKDESQSAILVAGSSEADAKNVCTSWVKKKEKFLSVPVANLEKYREREAFLQDVQRCVLTPAGKKMSRSCFEALVDKTGSDTRRIFGELEKLIVYVGTRTEISPKDVEALVGVSAEKKFYNFTQAVGDRKTQEAINIYNRLRMQGESSFALLKSLSGFFRQLLISHGLFGHLNRGLANSTQAFFTKLDRIKAAPPEGAGKESETFLKMHPFRVFNLFKQCLNFKESELTAKLLILKESETQIKAKSFAEQAFMETLIIKLTQPAKK